MARVFLLLARGEVVGDLHKVIVQFSLGEESQTCADVLGESAVSGTKFDHGEDAISLPGFLNPNRDSLGEEIGEFWSCREVAPGTETGAAGGIVTL